MFQSLRSGKITKKEKKEAITLTSFPEPNAHDTFLNLQKQHGANVYDEQQVLSALKKKYGVTIYKDETMLTLDSNTSNNGINGDDKSSHMSKRKDRRMYWMDDNYCESCYSCGSKFTLVLRKHHCRICGQIFCGACSNDRITGKFFGYSTPRVRCCESCSSESITFLTSTKSATRRRGIAAQEVTKALYGVLQSTMEDSKEVEGHIDNKLEPNGSSFSGGPEDGSRSSPLTLDEMKSNNLNFVDNNNNMITKNRASTISEGSETFIASPTSNQTNTTSRSIRKSLSNNSLKDVVNRPKSAGSEEVDDGEDTFSSKTPLKSFIRSKSPDAMNLNSFSSFRRRSSVRTNTFVSRNMSSSVRSNDNNQDNEDHGKNDVEQMKSLFRHKHASIIDLKNNNNNKRKDSSKEINDRFDEALEELGIIPVADDVPDQGDAGRKSEGRTRSSSMDNKVSRLMPNSSISSTHRGDSKNENDRGDSITNSDKDKKYKQMQRNNDPKETNVNNDSRHNSKGGYGKDNRQNQLDNEAFRNRSKPSLTLSARDIIIQNNDINLNDFTKAYRKESMRVIGWMSKQGRLSTRFQRRFFVLEANALFYYQRKSSYTNGYKPRGKINLDDVISIDHASDLKTLANHPFAIVLSTNSRNWTVAPYTASAMQQWLIALRCEFESCLERSEDKSINKDYEYFSTDEEIDGEDDMNGNDDLTSSRSRLSSLGRRSGEANLAPESRRRSSTLNIANYFVTSNNNKNKRSPKGRARATTASTFPSDQKDEQSLNAVADGGENKNGIVKTKEANNGDNGSTEDNFLVEYENDCVSENDTKKKILNKNNRRSGQFPSLLRSQSAHNLPPALNNHHDRRSISKKESIDDNNLDVITSAVEEDPKISKLHYENLRENVKLRIHNFLKKELLENECTKNSQREWINAVEPLVEKSIASVVPSTEDNDWLSILPYVKIKLIPGGKISNCTYVDGLVFRKMIAHRAMNGRIEAPRILLLKGALIYQPLHLTSFQALKLQEEHYMALQVQKIADLRPTVVMVGGGVSRRAMEMLLEKRITLLQNVKHSTLDRAARLLGATVVPSVAQLDTLPVEEVVGKCKSFEVVKCETISNVNKKERKQKNDRPFFSFFRGCPANLGCSLLIRGSENMETLKVIKKITRRALHYAFDWYLTSSFIHDAGLKETNPRQTPSYPSVMMFTKVDMTAGKQDTQAVQQRCIIYGLRDRTLSQYLDLECFRRKHIRSTQHKSSNKREQQKMQEVYFFQHNGRIRVQYMQIPIVSQPFPTVRLLRGENASNSYRNADFQINVARKQQKKANMIRYGSSNSRRDLLDGTAKEGSTVTASEIIKTDTLAASIIDGSVLRTWAFCIECNRIVTPCVVMTDQAMSLSFGSYLEKLFAPDLFSCRTGGCYHDSSKFHIRYFAKRFNVASIQIRRIPVYTAIPSQPFAIDPRFKRNYHDALGYGIKEQMVQQYMLFINFCIKQISFCDKRKNVLETNLDENAIAVDWPSIAKELRELQATVEKNKAQDIAVINVELEELGNYNAFPLFAKRREVYQKCVLWNEKLKEIFKDVTAGAFYSDKESAQLKSDLRSFDDDDYDDEVGVEKDGESGDLQDVSGDKSKDTDGSEEKTGDKNDKDSVNKNNQLSRERGDSTPSTSISNGDTSRNRSSSENLNGASANKMPAQNSIDTDGNSRNIGDLMDSMADDRDTGVNRVFKMLTSSRSPDMPIEQETLQVKVRILNQLNVGCPSLNAGVNGMFCPVDKDLPSTVIAYSLASLRTHSALKKFFEDQFDGESNKLITNDLPTDVESNKSENGIKVSEIQDNENLDSGVNHGSSDNIDLHGVRSNVVSTNKEARVKTKQVESPGNVETFYSLDNARKKRKILVSNKECDVVDKFKDVEGGLSFEVVTYFAAQFYALRSSYLVGDTEEDYIQSLVQSRPWRTSGGKSSAQFSKTLDGRFVIKCVSAEEFNMFHHQCACGVYFVYMDKTIFQNCPSALVKIMGMHRIKIRNSNHGISIKYVVVMQNLFAGVDTTNMRLFDLKGKIRYYTKRVQKGTVLLDGDLLRMTNGLPLPLTKDSNELVGDAINNDSLFLKIADIVDYSLIVGIDRRTKTVRMGVIDFMHSYDMKKRLESNLKGIISEATIRPPTVYSDRFLNGFETYFCAVPQDGLHTHRRRASTQPTNKELQDD